MKLLTLRRQWLMTCVQLFYTVCWQKPMCFAGKYEVVGKFFVGITVKCTEKSFINSTILITFPSIPQTGTIIKLILAHIIYL